MSTPFNKARTFMYRHARPLDLARFQYHFENGSKDAVVKALSFYQNEDGGCGHAVEADCWNPHSTPLHASSACAILQEIDFEDKEHPFIQGMIRWLMSGAHFDGKHWAIAVESNNAYPHAPWWHTESDSACHTNYNGTAQLAGFLVRYAPQNSEAFRLGMRIACEAIEALTGENLQDMHTCACYIHMMECLDKAGVTGMIPCEELRRRLHEAVHRLICTDVSRWGAYVCKPSAFLNSRESEFYPENQEAALAQCTYILQTQLEDGSWAVNWQWQDYPDEWAVSRMWWKGQIIIENLLYLKGFGRI